MEIADIQTREYKYYLKSDQNGQYAIFHIDNPNQPISQWWDWIKNDGILKAKSPYYIAVREKSNYDEYAIFRINNPYQPISRWWYHIFSDGLVNGVSDYYVAENNVGKHAIFHKDNPDEPISQWHDVVYGGLVLGKSHYYIVADKRDGEYRYAIFHKDNPDQPISGWWNKIYSEGLVEGSSDYYVVQNQHGHQHAIFHKDNPNEPVSKWWKSIVLGYNFSKYYLVYHNTKFAIFNIDNPDTPVSQWHEYIIPTGLVNGTSFLYAVQSSSTSSAVDVYHIDDPMQPLYEIPIHDITGVLYIDQHIAVFRDGEYIKVYKADKQQSYAFGTLNSEVVHDIDVIQTEQLIAQNIKQGIVPIAFYDGQVINMRLNPVSTWCDLGS